MFKTLSLNCQRGNIPQLFSFVTQLLTQEEYDFILLQEVEERVVAALHQARGPRYEMLFHSHHKNEIVVLYKRRFVLLREAVVDRYPYLPTGNIPWGAVMGVFEDKETHHRVGVCAIHLPPSYHILTRTQELKTISNAFRDLLTSDISVSLMGGDFNTIIPGERWLHARHLKDRFICMSGDEHTYDSERLEEHYRNSKIGKWFLMHRISHRLQLDHFYVDRNTHTQFKINSEVLREIVSDHYPITLEIKQK